jgi:hypothetical protein
MTMPKMPDVLMRLKQLDWRGCFQRWLHSWQAPVTVAVVLMLSLGWWAMPHRIDRVMVAGAGDGVGKGWNTGDAPPRTEFIWDEPHPLTNLDAPQSSGKNDIETATTGRFSPRLVDHGATLYFTQRVAAGHCDIFRMRRLDGDWEPPVAMSVWNTAADDVGVTFSFDGRTAVLSSNRPGGFGGFDLYVSTKTNAGWSQPQNLGHDVNSPVQESEPALGPDGQLFFSSNRTADGDQLVHGANAELSSEGTPGADKSSETKAAHSDDKVRAATLRAHPGLAQFDLYISSPGVGKEMWLAPRPLSELNRPGSNEGAPFFSPQGTFFYFASDRRVAPSVRPVRDHETANLDLYRARWDGARFTHIENLGAEINTPAHETEPGLSPEGFTLVFSSNRQGRDQLFESSAREVFHQTGWDTSNLQALSRIWWRALLLTGLLSGLSAGVWFNKGWIFGKASIARFLAASLCLHCAILLLMMFMPLAKVVIALAHEIRVSNPATQMFDNNQHQSHEAGLEAYEKLSDLTAREAQPVPEIERQATEPVNIPEPSDSPILNLPRHVSRSISPDRIEFVPVAAPANDEQSIRRPLELARPAPRMQAVAELEAETTLSPQAEVQPVESPLNPSALNTSRLLAAEMHQAERPEIRPATEIPRRIQAINLSTAAVEELAELPTAEETTPTFQTRVPLMRTPSTSQHAEPVPLPVSNVKSNDDVVLKSPRAEIQIARGIQAMPAAVQETPRDAKLHSLPRMNNAAQLADQLRQLVPDEKAVLTQVTAMSPGELTRRAIPLELRPTNIASIPVAQAAAIETPLTGRAIVLNRQPTSAPALSLPTRPEWGGRHKRLDERLIVGTLAPQRVDAAPSFSHVASQLNRPRALAKPVALANDNVGMEAMFTLRQGETRKEFIELFGGNQASEVAVNRGLEWLSNHQNQDGSWSLQRHEGSSTSDTAGTGFALLPFLAAGNTPTDGKYQRTVAKAVAWLLKTQKPNGDLLAPNDTAQHRMYAHGVAAIALCEVYGMTQQAELRDPAQRSLNYIAAAQHAPSGGWRYQPNEAGDTSVVGWQVMALKSGEMAGLTIPANTLEGAKRWLASVESNQPAGGQFGYNNRGVTPTMTAEGLLCIQFLGTTRNSARMRAGADFLLKNPPSSGRETSYYWYYGTQVMYHMQGEYWTAWNEKMRDLLVTTQVKDGPNAGTWNPADQWEKSGGRIYSTGIKLLMLEVYYRHLPLYQQLEQ